MNHRHSQPVSSYPIDDTTTASTGYLLLNDCTTEDTYSFVDLTSNESTRRSSHNDQSEHNFQIRFFQKPILCLHCQDYIWGAGYIGYGCLKCTQCVHFKCLIFVAKKLDCQSDTENTVGLDKITKQNLYPIENWSTDVVKQWLAVVNLHRYAEVFSKYNITGSKLITLNIEQLNEYRIRDSYHHKAILECCKELVVKSRQYSSYAQMIREQSEFVEHLKAHPYKANKHHFLLHTISVQTNCHSCLRPLLGIVHQAMTCQHCGIMVHRQCSSTGLPNCQLNNSRQLVNKHYLFGVSLFDLNNDEENSVPMLLAKAFTHIEDRASLTGEDLYDAYRLSADTAKIDQIKQQLNENGIELTRFESYDLNTICAIVKAFLRDLQNSVISEEIYVKLVSCISSINSAELRSLLKNQLHPQHYACLKFIMAHLIRVWTYQYKSRGCHYLPDKIFHIFRSILMRPPWKNIVEIVNNIEKQTLVIQRLMLECDWGVELPEYKLRPSRPNPYKSENNQERKTSLTMTSLNNIPSNLVQLAAKFIPSVKSPIKLRQSDQKNAIDNQEWYWANIVNRDNTNLILKSCPDGSFIVRNSTEKNPQAPYTLCVMKGTFVKSIKVFKQSFDQSMHSINSLPDQSNVYYDIEKPCRFESVQALIDYYSRVSLKEYNHNLDLKLTYGVSKFKFGRASEWSIDKLYSSFKEAMDKYEMLTKNCDNLELDLSIIREDIVQKRVATEAFDKVIAMFDNQLNQANTMLTHSLLKKSNAVSASAMLVTQFMPNTSSSDMEKIMQANKESLENKIVQLREKQHAIIESIEYLNLNLSELQEKLDSQRPELIELRKKRENYHMWLLQRGENEDKIQAVIEPVRQSSDSPKPEKPHDTSASSSEQNIYMKLKSSDDLEMNEQSANSSLVHGSQSERYIDQSSVSDPPSRQESMTMVHFDSLNWFRADFTREQSEQELKDKEIGTYLVRTSAFASSKYVLSVVSQRNQVIHVVIDESHNKYFLKSQNQRRLAPHDSNGTDGSQSPPLANNIPVTSSTSGMDWKSLEDNSLLLSNSSSSVGSANSENLNLKRERVNKFDTLTDLIVFYSKNMLQIGNKTWNIVLETPAFYENLQITTF